MDISTYLSRPRLLAAVAVALASLVAMIWMPLDHASAQPSASASAATAVDEDVAKMNLKPRGVELMSEKATRVRNAIKQGDYSTAHDIAAEVLARSHLQDWDFQPFSAFIDGVSSVDDSSFEAQLSQWVTRDKNDAIPILIRAQYYYDTGRFKRGRRFTRDIQAGNLNSFKNYMDRAIEDIDRAILLNGGNPYSFYLRLRILHWFGMSQRMKDAFKEAIAKYPTYYPLYDIFLATLEPRWGGTIEAMYAFVDLYAGHAADHSPLKLLYLSFYRGLLETASVSCSDDRPDAGKSARCVASLMGTFVRPDLEGQVRAAFQLFDHSDRYQFDAAVEPILFDMVGAVGGDAYSTAMLQLAADKMHSDTQLDGDRAGQNDFVIDKALAESWLIKGFYDNALKKDRDALKDIATAAFPSEAEKYLTVAGVFEHLGRIYNRLHQYADMIAAIKAAIALGDKTVEEHFICYGYYQLKDNDAAAQACTTAIDRHPANLLARYWRGWIYFKMNKADAALPDLTAVAESEDDFRSSAALAMSMIYFQRGDLQGALNLLNKYTYLYDPNTTSRENVAASYNNRCYAYMELGELGKALDDCNASLKYTSLPEAYRKQQELLKRLGR